MKRIIIILLLLCTSFLNAQVKTLNNFDFEKKEFLNPDPQKSKEFFSHHSISVGGGLTYGFELRSRTFLAFVSTSVHFSKTFHIELEFIGNIKKSESETYSLLLIPELGFKIDDKWKLYTGLGLAAVAEKNFGMIFPTGNLKIEYNICKWFSVNAETLAYPLTQKLNLSFNLPY